MKRPPLHPDIERDLRNSGREVVEVIDPSPGLWGGDPVPGLVTIVYQCPDPTHSGYINQGPHTHHALYGPRGSDPGSEGMELYAD
jgi:hypothetical protein